MLWHWAKRRHHNKPKQWIISKYWKSSGNRKWVFSGGDRQLNLLSDKNIVRHKRLKLDMNPFLDKDYFILRKIKLGINKITFTVNKAWDLKKKKRRYATMKQRPLQTTAARFKGLSSTRAVCGESRTSGSWKRWKEQFFLLIRPSIING
jgi:RNA-directed DNA polymerase